MTQTNVTVVIPCFNHEKWISEAIYSVYNENVSCYYDNINLRIVVVNDGSTDKSIDKILSFFNKEKMVYTKHENLEQYKSHFKKNTEFEIMAINLFESNGPSFARNIGIKSCFNFTDIFGFLDSDDIYLPKKITSSIKELLKDDRIGMVYSDYSTFKEHGKYLRQYKEPFSMLRLYQECIANSDSFIRKACFEKVGLFDESLRVCEDYDMWLRIGENFLISHIPEELLLIRIGEHSSTSKINSEIWKQCYAKVFQKTADRRNDS